MPSPVHRVGLLAIECGYRQQGGLVRQDHRGRGAVQPGARPSVRRVGHHQVQLFTVRGEVDAARAGEHIPGPMSGNGDLKPERIRSALVRVLPGRAHARQQSSHDIEEPPAQGGDEPSGEGHGLAGIANPGQLRQHQGNLGTQGRPAQPEVPERHWGLAAQHQIGDAQRQDIAQLLEVPSGPARPVQDPGAGYRDAGSVAQGGHRCRSRTQSVSQPLDDPPVNRHAGRDDDVERRQGKPLDRPARRAEEHSRVGGQVVFEPFVARISGTLPDPHDQVVDGVGDDLLGGGEHHLRGAVPGVDGHDVGRDGETATRLGPAEMGMRDQMRGLGPLDVEARLLGQAGVGALSLMPAHCIPGRNERASMGEGSVSELGVLHSPACEGLVEAAHLIEEPPADAEIAAGHHPEDVVGHDGQFIGPGHVELDPLRAVDPPALEQAGQGSRPVADCGRVDTPHIHMGAEPERQQIAGQVMPPGVRRQPSGLGKHVAVEEHQDGMARRPGSVVPGPRQPEPEILLMDHPHVQRAGNGWFQGYGRSVVNNDHLEQVTGVGLPLQRRQGQIERIGRLVVRDDDRHGDFGYEIIDRRRFQGTPVVTRYGGGWDWGGHRVHERDGIPTWGVSSTAGTLPDGGRIGAQPDTGRRHTGVGIEALRLRPAFP